MEVILFSLLTDKHNANTVCLTKRGGVPEHSSNHHRPNQHEVVDQRYVELIVEDFRRMYDLNLREVTQLDNLSEELEGGCYDGL